MGFFDRQRLMDRPIQLALYATLMWPVCGRAQPPEESALEDSALEVSSTDQEQAPELTNPVTRFEAQIEMQRFIAEGSYAQAAAVGETMLQLTELEFGSGSNESARANYALAEAQRRAEQFDAAETSYLRSIEIYRDNDGPFGESLIEPTIGLGDNYHDAGQYLNAVSAYNEARTIERRVNGLLSEGQLPLFDKMTETFDAMGMATEAREQQLSALMLIERNYPPTSVEVLEAIYRYARWLRSVYQFTEARVQYDRAIRIIRDSHGKESPLLVTPYREIGNSFREQGFEDNRGISALSTALEILEEQPAVDAMILGRTLLDIGDWRTAFGTVSSGGDEYLRCWETIGALEDPESVRSQWFESRRPVFVLTRYISDRGLSREPDALRGNVIVRFDIDAGGRPQNVAVVESNPSGFKDASAIRAISQSRFRPHIIDGQLTGAANLGVEFNFRYMPVDEDEATDL